MRGSIKSSTVLSGYCRSRWTRGWPLFLTGIAVILFGVLLEWQSPAFRLVPAAIAAGEWYRLLTGQLLHLGLNHLLLNLAGLLLVVHLFGNSVTAGTWGGLIAASLASTAAGLYWLEPGLGWYVGLSGALHGLLLGAILLDRISPQWERWLLGSVIVIKLLFEQWFGSLPFTEMAAGGPVIVSAHGYGAIGGTIFAVALLIVNRVGTSRRASV